jgi:hypothetical protein
VRQILPSWAISAGPILPDSGRIRQTKGVSPPVTPAIPPIGNRSLWSQPNIRSDYRHMVDAIQAGDLATAQSAYGAVTKALPGTAFAPDTTLGKIGASLDRGDLNGAQGFLNGLETKAMRVLRAVQDVTGTATSADTSDPESPQPGSFRITI